MIETLPLPSPVLPARRPAPSPTRVLAVGTGLALAALTVAAVGLLLDPRTITGAPAWLKPAKFGLSVALYLVTLRWMVSRVEGHRRLLAAAAVVLVACLGTELVLIDLQAARGTTSHFNESSVFDAAVYFSMGGLISVVFLATIVAGVLVLRARGADRAIAAGVRWGLVLALLGMAEAVLMTVNFGWSDGGGHTVGGIDGGPGLPITGWSTLHGDLRIGHFLGLHGLQALPILAFLLVRTGLSERVRTRLTGIAGLGYAGVVALVTWQALRGQPLLAPDAATFVAAAVLATVVLVGAGVVLLRRPSLRTEVI